MQKKQTVLASLVVLMSLVFSASAMADVAIKQKIKSTMFGGMFSSNGTIKTLISGDKQKTDTEMKMDLGIISGPTVKTTNIMRLDKEINWDIDHGSKTYTEHGFHQWQAFQDSMQAAQRQDMPEESAGPDMENITMEKPEFTIERTGKTKKIAGYECEGVVLRMVMRARDKETGDTGSFIMTDHMWVSKDCPGAEEFMAFSKKSAEKMGFDMAMNGMQSSFAMMGLEAGEFADKMQEIGGFPLKQTLNMSISGEISGGTQMDSEQQQAMQDAKAALKNLGGLGGLFGKKSKKSDTKAEKAGDESVIVAGSLIQVTIEVDKISTKDLKPEEFEVPKGYQKRD